MIGFCVLIKWSIFFGFLNNKNKCCLLYFFDWIFLVVVFILRIDKCIEEGVVIFKDDFCKGFVVVLLLVIIICCVLRFVD